MRLTQLDVVNQCLASMGETPLNSIDSDHPFVAAALLKMKTTNTQEQAKGWWFNTDFISLQPDPNTGFVYVPADAINVNPDEDGGAYVIRGRRLYNRFTSSYEFTRDVSVVLVREIPFDDLPMLANHMIAARTVLDFQNDYDGDGDKYNKLGAAYQQVFTTLKAEHIRQVGANMLRNPSVVSQLRLIRPMSRYHRRSW
ncbi:tail tubular protein A [Burkholderia phage AMP1]|uniref:Tail tubular protein A n=5 Tax=Ampunavirus BpAMP1 TaxID=2733589 RepID=A0A5C2IBR9_9CAUD|nr:tail protein [Burkholderia phage Bp-AMP1]QEP52861.1 tail tubular protein A [Burkholderia phage AMP1]CDL65191.1 Tail tuber protein A [Burkholderia phage Bp-AMP2]CDL65231.1 Tail tuber protein A [Burkholderia phage Bp-AMP3]CDL65271.1 tail tuber protein A [Burkholderia phage Bp-AMP4]CDK30105.1 Tail tuber protein A [Burkholderia phage Bp-AMP1]